MKKIRQGVFETNSSSMHSVHIAESSKDTIYKTINPNEEGVIEISSGKYGWDEETFSSVNDKASYAFTYTQYGDEERLIEMLRSVIKKHTGCNEVVFLKTSDEYYPKGYIDHQSTEVLNEAFSSEESLKEFLFNPESYFQTDNDNH